MMLSLSNPVDDITSPARNVILVLLLEERREEDREDEDWWSTELTVAIR
jgi:hypothetical protein